MFITFEGIDGSGKSTQLRLLQAKLEADGYQVITTREPGGTELGKHIRELLLHTPTTVDPLAELFLFAADRAQHVNNFIRPALQEKKWVLCDRYIDSTIAYQGYGRGLDIAELNSLNHKATSGLLPHKTFLLDGAVEQLIARTAKRQQYDRMEAGGIAFLEKIRNGYLEISKQEPHRFIVLDALHPPEVVFRQILNTIQLH